MTEEQIEHILDWLVHNFVQVLLIFSIFIQITPIKWNPISSFVKWFGKLLNQDVNKQIEGVEDSIEDIKTDISANEKDRIRWEILEFANSCRNGINHSHDEFRHITDLHDKYVQLLERTGDQNGVFNTEYEWIQSIYKKKLDNNDFLK